MREAVVLAGGFGTRLQEVVPDLPKPMAPVAGRPFLELLLANLSSRGFGRVVLSLGFMAEKVSGHFGDRRWGLELIYVVEDVPLGTGGATRLALTHCAEDHVFVLNGDTYLEFEVDDLEQHWHQHHHPIIVGKEVPDAARYGRLLTDQGRVIGFNEKGTTGAGLVNAGCYVFKRDQLDGFALDTPFSLESDYLVGAVSRVRFDLFVTLGRFIDIGVPDDLARAQVELREV